VEGEIAALAAERANDEHLRQLERAVHDLQNMGVRKKARSARNK
jgi:DNA-binding FadR family transcriptional regulator